MAGTRKDPAPSREAPAPKHELKTRRLELRLAPSPRRAGRKTRCRAHFCRNRRSAWRRGFLQPKRLHALDCRSPHGARQAPSQMRRYPRRADRAPRPRQPRSWPRRRRPAAGRRGQAHRFGGGNARGPRHNRRGEGQAGGV